LRIFPIALTSCAIATFFFAGHARADLDQRWFVGNFIGYSAQPENYFSISGGIDRTQNFESVYLEKTISAESSLSLFAGYQRLEQQGESTAGWSNLTLAYKRVLIAIPQREFVLSISPGVELPVGNRSVGSESHTRAGFDLLVEKGLVDLPDSLRMLRPAALEGDVGFDKKVSGAQDGLVAVSAELEYSLAYLDEYVAGNRLPAAIRNFTPHLDFDYAQYLSAHRNTSAPDFELTPAVAWLNSIFEVNVGVQVAVNRSSSTTGAVAFVWLVGVSPNQIVPALGWTPFQ
jgi:hypothetical protein